MMTLEDAVDHIFAFKHGENGDIFVQKAPAAKIKTRNSLLKLYKAKNKVHNIGTRHGEKCMKLVNREDMAKPKI